MKHTASDETALSFFVQLAEDLNSTLELDELLPLVAARVKPYVGYDRFGILLLDPNGSELRFRFGLGYADEVMKYWRFGHGQGIIGNAAKTGESILVPDVREDPRYINAHSDTRSELAIPLVAKQTTIGVLDVQSNRPRYFNEQHQRLLGFAADSLANAIENARLYENLREQTGSLSLLNELGRELTSILDLEPLLNKVAELVRRIVDYHGFSVFLWNEESRRLEPTVATLFDRSRCAKRTLELGEGLTGTAAALRQAVRVPNVHLDARHISCDEAVEIRSELAVPLVFKDRLIGVLDLDSTEYNAFTDRHESLLSTLTSYISVAIENARLYERVRQDEHRLAEDLAQARDIQSSLLPEAPPEVPGLDIAYAYRPASQLGGDIYDFLPYGEGRLAIMIGDVVGKATAAALQGSMAIGILRGHVVEHFCDPATMLRHVNEHLLQPSMDNRFVAMAYAVYDQAERTLTVANGGFTRPRLVRDGEVEEIPVQGLPLGLMADPSYEQRTIALRPGDVVVFCSDGIHEAVGRGGEQFGTDGLRQTALRLAGLAAQRIADGMMEATEVHGAQSTEHEDDRTIVVLKVVD